MRCQPPRVRSLVRGNLAEIWTVYCLDILYGPRQP